jgi:hypothetical protein
MYPFQPARFAAGEVPESADYEPVAAQTFKKGRVLTRVGAKVQAHALGATVTGVFGVAMAPAENGRAIGPDPRVPVAKANRVDEFLGQAWRPSTSTIVSLDRDTHLGQRYGLIFVDGETFINIENTTNLLIEITGVKTELNIALFKFLETTLQQP